MNGQRLKERRKKKGLTARQIAESLGVSRVSVSRWESGKHEPDDDTKFTLANALDTSVAYLMGETDDPSVGFLEIIRRGLNASSNDTLQNLEAKAEHHTIDLNCTKREPCDFVFNTEPIVFEYSVGDKKAKLNIPQGSKKEEVKTVITEAVRAVSGDDSSDESPQSLELAAGGDTVGSE